MYRLLNLSKYLDLFERYSQAPSMKINTIHPFKWCVVCQKSVPSAARCQEQQSWTGNRFLWTKSFFFNRKLWWLKYVIILGKNNRRSEMTSFFNEPFYIIEALPWVGISTKLLLLSIKGGPSIKHLCVCIFLCSVSKISHKLLDTF